MRQNIISSFIYREYLLVRAEGNNLWQAMVYFTALVLSFIFSGDASELRIEDMGQFMIMVTVVMMLLSTSQIFSSEVKSGLIRTYRLEKIDINNLIVVKFLRNIFVSNVTYNIPSIVGLLICGASVTETMYFSSNLLILTIALGILSTFTGYITCEMRQNNNLIAIITLPLLVPTIVLNNLAWAATVASDFSSTTSFIMIELGTILIYIASSFLLLGIKSDK